MVLGMVMKEWLAVIEQDHEAAVARLNRALNLKGDAMLDPNVPPHTFVGDIDNVSPVKPGLVNLISLQKQCYERYECGGKKNN